MENEKVDLYEYFKIKRAGAGGFLTAFAPTQDNETKRGKRPAMLVIPGGAYRMISDREGAPVARAYERAGHCAFVLEYSVDTAYPVPLSEACMAVAYIRENAERYRVDKEKVAAVGFSAGGHLAAMLATICDEKEVTSVLGERDTRPNAVILCYPVTTLGEFTHEETCNVITGGDAALRQRLSIEKCVTKGSAPAFIWHTATDDLVPVENALCLAAAYRRAGVKFSLHVFEKGWHGLSLCTREVLSEEDAEAFASVGAWFALSLDFLKLVGIE